MDRGARFRIPPYGIWMQMILDRTTEPALRC
jgi:hypothetical protein